MPITVDMSFRDSPAEIFKDGKMAGGWMTGFEWLDYEQKKFDEAKPTSYPTANKQKLRIVT
jgi:hypothetical protein